MWGLDGYGSAPESLVSNVETSRDEERFVQIKLGPQGIVKEADRSSRVSISFPVPVRKNEYHNFEIAGEVRELTPMSSDQETASGDCLWVPVLWLAPKPWIERLQ